MLQHYNIEIVRGLVGIARPVSTLGLRECKIRPDQMAVRSPGPHISSVGVPPLYTAEVVDDVSQEQLSPSCASDGKSRVSNSLRNLRLIVIGNAGGQYYKGEVVKVRQRQPSPGASLAEHETYDPWEALDVEWEMGGALEAEEGGCLRVSPWEIEADPETEARRLEELRKQEEASARAARALAKSRRYVRAQVIAHAQPVAHHHGTSRQVHLAGSRASFITCVFFGFA